MVGRSALLVLVLASCTGKGGAGDSSDSDTGTTSDTSDTQESTGDTEDTVDTGDSGSDSGDTSADTGDTGADTGDTGADTGDTGADTGDTGDTGADTGDTGADTGDTGADTGDTDADTGDTGSSSACLVYTTEMRNGSGACTATNRCLIIDPTLTAAGIVTNTCGSSVTFTTPTTCLVGSWTLVSSSGTASSISVACGDVVMTWAVPAGGSVEETEEWGPLSAGSYELSVTFDDAGRDTATDDFDVYGM